ncbi:MAG: tryptophan synthase subunit alpha [Pseudomonadota bacterium]
MSRITACFERLADEQKKALVVYVVAGDPVQSVTVDLMHALVAAGVSIIELGVPFTDPEADGPAIQLATRRALDAGTTLTDTLALLEQFRARDQTTPVVLMGYLNPIEQMGYEVFAQRAALAGADGTITVNVPPEEGELLDESLIKAGIDPVYLLAPTTTESRAKYIFSRSRGFAYYVSLKGTTGASTLDVTDVTARLDKLRPHATLPIAVGFGIKNGDAARQVAEIADGVVIGAAVVDIMAANADNPDVIPEKVGEFVRGIRTAMDGAGTTEQANDP